MFTDEIRANYRIVLTQYGNGESEETLPLGSWKKGSGLAGKSGHVYAKGKHEAGIWLIRRNWRPLVDDLMKLAPSLRILQPATGEITLAVSWIELPALLPVLGAKRRRKASAAQLAAAKKGYMASPL